MASGTPISEYFGDFLGGAGILIYFILICLMPLLAIPYLYAAIFSVIPWFLSVMMILYGVVFIAHGAIGLLSFVTGIEGMISYLLPQLGPRASLGIYIALLFIIGPALLVAGKQGYGPAKRFSLRSLHRLRYLFSEYGINGFAWILPEATRLGRKLLNRA